MGPSPPEMLGRDEACHRGTGETGGGASADDNGSGLGLSGTGVMV